MVAKFVEFSASNFMVIHKNFRNTDRRYVNRFAVPFDAFIIHFTTHRFPALTEVILYVYIPLNCKYS